MAAALGESEESVRESVLEVTLRAGPLLPPSDHE